MVQFRIVYITCLIIVSLFYSGYEATDTNYYFKNDECTLVEACRKLTRGLKSFLRVPADVMENKRRRVRRALLAFIKTVVCKGKPGDCDDEQYVRMETEYILTTPELITAHGFKAESHTVETVDGYIITVHRIIPKKQKICKDSKRKVALLHHGLLGSSSDWVLLGPTKSLPYILAEVEYDVWLTNVRGNMYSRYHDSKNEDSSEYWDFSWYEMGIYDLPAVIDYIKQVTDGASIDFIGHSMGGTALLILLSTFPRYNHVLRSATLLAPLAFMYKVIGPMRVFAEFYSKYGNESLSFLGETEFMPRDTFPRSLINQFCRGDEALCLNPLLFIANGGQKIPNEHYRHNVLNHVPAGGSMKTILHYCQLVMSGQFQMYDYGEAENLKRYGFSSPPTFRLNDLTLPTALFSSASDWLCSEADVRSLLPHLPNALVHHVIRKNGYSHTDFLWGEDSPHLVYYPVLDILNRNVTTKRH